MFTQDDIDAVLNQAQDAVNSLAEQTGALAGGGEGSSPHGPAASAAPGRQSTSPRSSNLPPQFGGMADAALWRILKIRVPVVVRIAERPMLMSEVTQLAPGSIVEFEKRVDAELNLMVNNTQIGAGEAIKVGEHFGLRVHYVGNVKQRIALLGKK